MSDHPTFEQIAKRAGVAKSTVSLALRNSPKLLEKTRLRIQDVARQLGYKPNPLVSAQMAYIRSSKTKKSVSTIGFVNTWYEEANHQRLKWEVMGRFHQGVKERVEQLGFHFEHLEFDMSVYSKRRMEEIIKARNIDALVLSPLRRATTELVLNWDPYAVVSIGYFATFGNIHRVFYDSFSATEAVLKIAKSRGYKRIGFITNAEAEQRAGRLWSSAFLEFQSRCIPKSGQVPLLRMNLPEAEYSKPEFTQIENWYREHKPDLIISFLDRTLRHLRSIGLRSPEDFGYISMIWSEYMGDIAGYNQDFERVGKVAVDIVVDRLFQNKRGESAHPSSTSLIGEFVEGRTLRPAHKS